MILFLRPRILQLDLISLAFRQSYYISVSYRFSHGHVVIGDYSVSTGTPISQFVPVTLLGNIV